MISYKRIAFWVSSVFVLASCNDDFSHLKVHDKPRAEYAPNMYVSEAYEPLTQVVDSVKYGNEYSSNPYNKLVMNSEMNMRTPAPNSVPRNVTGNWPYYRAQSEVNFLPYTIHKDSLELAARTLKNPYDSSEAIVKQGEVLYQKFCLHCHGETGQGDGEVGKRLAGVPPYNSQRLKNVSGGYIFHVITHGKGRMGAHGSIVNQEERWKIVRYVQTLQKQATE
jgi:mono/diheme cytochrome c family protein